jgi:hypothetical protein
MTPWSSVDAGPTVVPSAPTSAKGNGAVRVNVPGPLLEMRCSVRVMARPRPAHRGRLPAVTASRGLDG